MWCCPDMGQALHSPNMEGDVHSINNTPTMAEVIRERKKKSGISGSSLGTLRRKLANVARRQNSNSDSGCSHSRHIRSVVSAWRVAAVCALRDELSAGERLRDVTVQAELARAPAPALLTDLRDAYNDRWCADVEMEYLGVVLPAHRAILCARSGYFRALLTARDARNGRRIRLDGLPPHFSVSLLQAVLVALYQGTPNNDAECVCNRGDLDIISSDRTTSRAPCSCSISSSSVRRAAAELGLREQPLADYRYLLDSGEYSDCRLVFLESGQSRCVLAVHRVMLAARSRFFRGVMCRVTPCSEVCVDEKVLPRRFAAAILHAAYTDQVDLSLIGRHSTSPTSTATSTNNSNNNNNNTNGKASWSKSLSQLEDAFQLYEIARFLEMPIVAQGCEDAMCRLLAADVNTLGPALRWAHAPHASKWLHRQALRMLRERLLVSCSVPAPVCVPRAALETALASPLLQAAEHDVLKAVIRWGEAQIPSGRRRPEREDRDTSLRHLLAPLLAHVRLEHISPDCDIMQQAIRRGLVTAPTESAWNSADAWLGRGNSRPCRIFLPYLDEIKALVESYSVPAAEVARERRARCVHRIPDTLYMVAASRESPPPLPADSAESAALLSPRLTRVLHTRVNELMTAPHVNNSDSVCVKQICLRAVREHSLPDSCAALLMPDCDRASPQCIAEDSTRSLSTSSLRQAVDGSCPSTSNEAQRDRGRARLSLAVPDVAMAPNANTHLLTARDYGGAVLQLDLGDGATHTPRPGSRAQRARHLTDQSIGRPSSSAVEDDELRNAIELSVMRAYSGYPRSISPRSPRCSHPNITDRRYHIHDSSPHIHDRNSHMAEVHVDRSAVISRLSDRSPHVSDRTANLNDRTANLNDRTVNLSDRTVNLSDRTANLNDRTSHTSDRTERNQHAHLSDRSPHPSERSLLNAHANDRSAHLSDRSPHPSDRIATNAHISDRSPHVSDRNIHGNLHLSDNRLSDALNSGHSTLSERHSQSAHLSDINVHLGDRSGQGSRVSDRSANLNDRTANLSDRTANLSDRTANLSDRTRLLSDINIHPIDRIAERSTRSPHVEQTQLLSEIAFERTRERNRSPHIELTDRNNRTDRNRSPHLDQQHLSELNAILTDRNHKARSPHLEQNSHLSERAHRTDRTRSPHLDQQVLTVRPSRSLDPTQHMTDRSVLPERSRNRMERNRSPHDSSMGDIAARCDRSISRTGSLSRSMTMDRKPLQEYQYPTVHTLQGYRVSRHGYCTRPSNTDYR